MARSKLSEDTVLIVLRGWRIVCYIAQHEKSLLWKLMGPSERYASRIIPQNISYWVAVPSDIMRTSLTRTSHSQISLPLEEISAPAPAAPAASRDT